MLSRCFDQLRVRLKRILVPALSLALLLGCAYLPSMLASSSEGKHAEMAADIKKTLNAQVAAWNSGDLDLFMKSYLNSPNTSYVSQGKSIRGYENIRSHYVEKYGKPGPSADSDKAQKASAIGEERLKPSSSDGKKDMGKLSLSNLDVRILNKDHALASGDWKLQLDREKEKNTYQGRFSLVLILKEGAWKIVHDHTSSSDAIETRDFGESMAK